jgi:hypothetical protein
MMGNHLTTGDERCLRHLHELFELMEHMTLNGSVFEVNME